MLISREFISLAGLILFLMAVTFSLPFHSRKAQSAAAGIMPLGSDASGLADKGYYTIIGCSEEDSEYAGTVKRIADSVYPAFERDFDIDTDEKVSIVIYSDPLSLSAGLGVNYAEKPPMGVYYKGVISILSPGNWYEADTPADITDKFIESGPVVHEMAHWFLDKKTKGNYKIWFSEGVALFYENKYTGFVWREDLEGSGKGATLQSMEEMFIDGGDDAAYRSAFEAVRNIALNHGEDALPEIYSRLESGEDFSYVLGEYF